MTYFAKYVELKNIVVNKFFLFTKDTFPFIFKLYWKRSDVEQIYPLNK